MSPSEPIRNVLVTGATGFVGRSVVRELLRRGLTPVCLVRSPQKLFAQHPDVSPDRLTPIAGTLDDRRAIQSGADICQAVIHLVGIIIQRRLHGKTFRRIHVTGTRRIVEAAQRAGIERLVHMSALGSGPDAVSPYHKSKWEGEELVRLSGLDVTIFRPSLIHGPHGEFTRLLRRFTCGRVPPATPYFGTGRARVQPVSVKDVAYCLVESLYRPKTQGQAFSLGGPRAYTWVELYETCRRIMPGARTFKPLVSLPVGVAKVLATLSGPPMAMVEMIVPSLGMFRFDTGQVSMSQQDCVCDHAIAERAFGIGMREFETDLAGYFDLIR